MYIKAIDYLWQQLCKLYNIESIDTANKMKTVISKVFPVNGTGQWSACKRSIIAHSEYERRSYISHNSSVLVAFKRKLTRINLEYLAKEKGRIVVKEVTTISELRPWWYNLWARSFLKISVTCTMGVTVNNEYYWWLHFVSRQLEVPTYPDYFRMIEKKKNTSLNI